MAAFQRLAHHLGVPTHSKVVGAAVRSARQMRDDLVALDFLRVDEVRHAELLGHRLAWPG
jgi:hypothetical protein